MARGSGGFDVSCVAHVHSTYSDGTATVPELLAAARHAGADAVLLTDHDTLAARRDGWEGWRHRVFLLAGAEITAGRGHYLAFGDVERALEAVRTPQAVAAAVRAAGGVGFAAHPFSEGGHMLVAPLARRIVLPHGWAELDQADGCDGLELWSVTTDAAEAWRTPAEAWRWLRDPEVAVAQGPPAHHLHRWDALSAHRRMPAIGGLDAHAPGVRAGGRVLSPLPHERTFGLLRTHLVCDRALSGDLDQDRSTLIGALAAGSAWLTCPCVAPAHGARFWAELGDGTLVHMGEEAAAGRAVVRVRLPQAADITLVRDGVPLHDRQAGVLDFEVERAGVYRVEARIAGRLWLLSNPVCLR